MINLSDKLLPYHSSIINISQLITFGIIVQTTLQVTPSGV